MGMRKIRMNIAPYYLLSPYRINTQFLRRFRYNTFLYFMKQILIVDDDPDILDAISLTLEDQGYTITSSTKGETAEELVTAVSVPDLLILDVLLSGKDGRDITRKLKRNKKTQDIPILMISAHPSAHKTARDAGADEFLAKPFEIEDLVDTVSKLLQ